MTLTGSSSTGITLGSNGISVANDSSLTVGSAAKLTVGSNQTWQTNGTGSLSSTGGLAINSLLTLGTGQFSFSSSSNSGAGGVTINGSTVNTTVSAAFGTGLLTLKSGTLNWNYSTSNSSGIDNALALTGNFTVGSNTTRYLAFSGGGTVTGAPTLTLADTTSSGGTRFTTNALSLGSNLTFAGSGNATISAPLTEVSGGPSRSVIFNGSGTVVLSGVNTYTGSTTVNSGTVQVTGSLAGTSTINMGGGTLAFTGSPTTATVQTLAATNFSGGISSVAAASGATGISETLDLGPISRSAGATASFSLPATGTIKTSSANANFSGGQQSILGGYATIGTNWATVTADGTLAALATGNTTIGSGYGTGYTSSNKDINFGVATTNYTTTSTRTINSLRFGNTSDTSTVTTAGSLAIATGGILLAGTQPDIIGPASGSSATLTSNNGSDLIVLAQRTGSSLTINYNIVNSSSGLNSNVIGLTKAGPGKLVLTGNNTYTGPTVIHAGTVQADNTTRSLGTNTTTVRGGTLAGVGQTGGAVVIENGGTISAGTGSTRTAAMSSTTGDTVGHLSTGNQTWNAGGTYTIKFHDNSGVAGTSYDQLSLETLSLSQLSSQNRFNLVLTQAANSTFSTPANGTKFTIALASGGTGYIAGSNITDLFYLSSSDVGISDSSLFSVTVGSQGGSLMLTYGSDTQSAPEPHTLLLSGMASSVLLVRRRNKTRPLT